MAKGVSAARQGPHTHCRELGNVTGVGGEGTCHKSLKVQEQNSYFSQLFIRDCMNPFYHGEGN